MQTLVHVQELQVGYEKNGRTIPILKGLNFSIEEGEIVGLVGESGCGKSMTALALMGLLKHRGLRVLEGDMLWNGQSMVTMNDHERRQLAGAELAMIFQEPMTALNPVLTIGTQLTEQIRAHRKLSKKAAQAHAVDMLRKVGISSPESRLRMYPHELSGGMRQRVMIAMAASCNPRLLIADEPTTALDVTIQAQILELLAQLVRDTNQALLFITHDLGIVANYCQRVLVMYSGKIVEMANVSALFQQPAHPYTKALIASVQSLERNVERVASIPGHVPAPGEQLAGCVFASRCTYATTACHEQQPPLVQIAPQHSVSCWHARDVQQGGDV